MKIHRTRFEIVRKIEITAQSDANNVTVLSCRSKEKVRKKIDVN